MSFWLLMSFFSIISLLILFILYTLGYFRGQVKEQIIKYNDLFLSNTVQTYENRFQLIIDSTLNFSFNENIPQKASSDFDYLQAARLQGDILKFLENKSLFLDNLLVYYNKRDLVLEKVRGKTPDRLFGEYLVSERYPASFWTSLSRDNLKYRLYPIADFSELDVNEKKLSTKVLLPLTVHNAMLPDIDITAMLDVQAMRQVDTLPADNIFYIMDDRQQPLYYSQAFDASKIPELQGRTNFQKLGDHYFFSKKGSFSGFTYLYIIPANSITLQYKWKLNFVSLLALTILISVLASFYFRKKLNQPLQRMIDSLNASHAVHSRYSYIDEYNVLHNRMQDMKQTNDMYHHDLSEKNSLLQYYSYINKVKKINDPLVSMKVFVEEKYPYRLVLFRFYFKSKLEEDFDVEGPRAAFYIREFINNTVSQAYAESLTFQVEKDQILCLIVGDYPESEMSRTIVSIKEVLDLDRAYFFSTIVIGEPIHRSSELNRAYENNLILADNRVYDDQTQLIVHSANVKENAPLALALTATQENEWDVNIKSGNPAIPIDLLTRKLSYARKNGIRALIVVDFADALLNRTKKTLASLQADTAIIETAREQLSECYTYERLQDILSACIRAGAEQIQLAKGQKDPTTDYICNYLEQHYDEEVTMDLFADKLNMSRSYLSTYFKEKTGINYLDYLNQIRTDKAKGLLANTNSRIQDIALKVGYNNINSFNRMFKKYTGLTPNEFRQTNKGSD